MNQVGRPPKFASGEELESLIESYFADCEERKEPPFITEMCVWLDTSRKVLLEYEEKEEFRNTIKRAKQKCEAAIEKGMMLNKMNATGSIFNLKNNYGWEERIKQDNTHEVGTETKSLIEKALGDL
jgi:hypothetical protein